MFLICAFNREHDLQIYNKAQWRLRMERSIIQIMSIRTHEKSLIRQQPLSPIQPFLYEFLFVFLFIF